MSSNLPKHSTANSALLAAAMIPVAAANAAVIVFPLDGTEGVTSFTKTVSGVTLTLSNPVEVNGVFAFGVYGNPGLSLSSPGLLVSAFNFSFSSDVVITGYNLNTVIGTPSGTFSLSAPGSTTSPGNLLATTGDHAITGGFAITANTLGTFVADIPGSGQANLQSITVSTVPEPSEWAALTAAACGGIALFLRRRK